MVHFFQLLCLTISITRTTLALSLISSRMDSSKNLESVITRLNLLVPNLPCKHLWVLSLIEAHFSHYVCRGNFGFAATNLPRVDAASFSVPANKQSPSFSYLDFIFKLCINNISVIYIGSVTNCQTGPSVETFFILVPLCPSSTKVTP